MNRKIMLSFMIILFIVMSVVSKKKGNHPLILTIEELKQFDGKNSEKKLVAYKNNIFDITLDKNWIDSKYIKDGAGIDLTKILTEDEAKQMFVDSKKVGKLVKGFTIEELSKYNGKNNMPSYIAVNGLIYDVSDYRLWKNGKHMGQHTAGKDLTKAFKRSPHNKKFLLKIPLIGKIVKKKN